MQMEERLVDFALHLRYDDIPAPVLEEVKWVVLGVAGTTLAGWSAPGVAEARELARRCGEGPAEASVLVFGDRVSAYNAVLINSIMARALDFDEGMVPGIHLGASVVPVGLAAAEVAGGVTGQEFLAALTAGMEVAARINSACSYDGFDPTGVCTPLASTVVAGRILGLDKEQLWHALGLAFNMSAGSFQSNVEGTLAVRFIQGFASQAGLRAVALARLGVTGVKQFLTGHYGFFHLFRGKGDEHAVLGGLGDRFVGTRLMFKRHPSCGGTLTAVDAALAVVAETGITPAEIAEIHVRVAPYQYKLVGHPFALGPYPTVNAQFSLRYAVASAFVRRHTDLTHFQPERILDPEVQALVSRVHVWPDPEVEQSGILHAEMEVKRVRGDSIHKAVTIPRGHPDNPLSAAEHERRFQQCIEFSGLSLGDRATTIRDGIARLAGSADARSLAQSLVVLRPES